MKALLLLVLVCFTLSTQAQRKAEGIYDSLNGPVTSMTVYFYKAQKAGKNKYEYVPDYFSHHQTFIYDDNQVLLMRNFYEDKKKIRESRDMVAFNKPNPAITYDTVYLKTDSSDEVRITIKKNGKIDGGLLLVQVPNRPGVRYRISLNDKSEITVYDRYEKVADGEIKERWQVFANAPLDLKKDPNTWQKFNEHGHLILTVFNTSKGKQSQARRYKYDDYFNATEIIFLEWDAETDTYNPVSMTELSYTYNKKKK